jgi:hypothetical protein
MIDGASKGASFCVPWRAHNIVINKLQRDMFLNTPFVTDLQQLQRHHQELIDQRLIAANTKRFSHDYAIGDEVLKLSYKPDKLEPRATGPFIVTRVHQFFAFHSVQYFALWVNSA